MAEKHRYRKRYFKILLNEEEMEALELKAKKTNGTKSDVIRDIIFYGEVRRNRKQILSDEQFEKMLAEMKCIGNKINQVAYTANLKKATGNEEIVQLRQAYEELVLLYEKYFL